MIHRILLVPLAVLLMLSVVSCKKVKIDPAMSAHFAGIKMVEKVSMFKK